MQLEERFSGPTLFDFDAAVMTLAARMETVLQETTKRTEPLPPQAPKGYHFVEVPRYRLMDLLSDEDDDALRVHPDEALEIPETLRDLPAALL